MATLLQQKNGIKPLPNSKLNSGGGSDAKGKNTTGHNDMSTNRILDEVIALTTTSNASDMKLPDYGCKTSSTTINRYGGNGSIINGYGGGGSGIDQGYFSPGDGFLNNSPHINDSFEQLIDIDLIKETNQNRNNVFDYDSHFNIQSNHHVQPFSTKYYSQQYQNGYQHNGYQNGETISSSSYIYTSSSSSTSLTNATAAANGQTATTLTTTTSKYDNKTIATTKNLLLDSAKPPTTIMTIEIKPDADDTLRTSTEEISNDKIKKDNNDDDKSGGEEDVTDITEPTETVEPVIDILITNVVCSFSVGCHLSLRDIALSGFNVEYKRESGMVTMKLRRPYTTASIWASGRITCTGATSELEAKIAARRCARCLQKLGFKIKLNRFRIVNVLGTCSMPWGIRIANFSKKYKKEASYEPELHPGATYRLKNPKATFKIFSTGSITVTASSVENVQKAIEHIYPLVFEFRVEKVKEENHTKYIEIPADVEEGKKSSGLSDSDDDQMTISDTEEADTSY